MCTKQLSVSYLPVRGIMAAGPVLFVLNWPYRSNLESREGGRVGASNPPEVARGHCLQ